MQVVRTLERQYLSNYHVLHPQPYGGLWPFSCGRISECTDIY